MDVQELLHKDFEFILTRRFEGIPLERRCGQYRQINGGRFLVGLKIITYPEKFFKYKSLLKTKSI